MEPEALTMIEEQGKLLSHVSNARLFEEVLKLFHGGAAYETYLLLRKYGLFKYLFPFTDQIAIDGVEGLPERALQNTDKRVKQGKPVIPAFLFACMMWDPVKADAQVLMGDGANESHAWRVAMNDGLRDQNQYVAVPRRLAEIILDIWNIHFRLIKRNPRMVKACLNNRRFRAAYDFLLLRTMVHEVDEEISEWWTEIQELEQNDREEMISELNKTYKKDRQPRQSNNEPDGNSVDYNSAGHEDNYGNTVFGDGYEGGFGKPGGNKNNGQKKQNRGQKSSGGRKQGQRGGQRNQQNKNGAKANNNGQAKTGGQRDRRAKNGQGVNANNSTNGNGEQPNNARRGKAGKKRSSKKRTNNSGQRRGGANANRQNSRGRNNSESRFQEARPADEYGVTSSGSNKKVKVRRKRRVVGPADNDDKPVLG